MFFKLMYIIKPLALSENEKVDFVIQEKESFVRVELERVPKEELSQFSKKGELKCTVSTEKIIDNKIEEIFKNIDNACPPSIKKLFDEISEELSNFIILTVYNFRWKLGIADSNNPILFKTTLRWSFDGKQWEHLLFDENATRLVLDFGLPMKKITENELVILKGLITNKTSEPLGHELFSEAWELRESNPRSSLVIGIAAAEAGFRECVNTLIPQAGWLIHNIQSPPLIAMLNKFLPLLPCKKKIWGEIISPPKEMIKILNEGVESRNRIAHGKSSILEKNFLKEFLSTVRDLLYLLDYYSGHEWAWGNISHTTSTALVRDAKKKHTIINDNKTPP